MATDLMVSMLWDRGGLQGVDGSMLLLGHKKRQPNIPAAAIETLRALTAHHNDCQDAGDNEHSSLEAAIQFIRIKQEVKRRQMDICLR